MNFLEDRFAFGAKARLGSFLWRLRFRPLKEVKGNLMSQANRQALPTKVAHHQVLLYARSAFRLQSPTKIKL